MEKQKQGVKKGQLIQLNMVRAERSRSRKCKCDSPVYLVDFVNDLVECEECGSIVEPLNAMKDVAERFEDMNERHQAIIQRNEELMQYWSQLQRIERFMKPIRKFLAFFKKGD